MIADNYRLVKGFGKFFGNIMEVFCVIRILDYRRSIRHLRRVSVGESCLLVEEVSVSPKWGVGGYRYEPPQIG